MIFNVSLCILSEDFGSFWVLVFSFFFYKKGRMDPRLSILDSWMFDDVICNREGERSLEVEQKIS